MTFPLGPYHPALIEPLSLRLAMRGEKVTGVETHMGYAHRGVEALATERDLLSVLDLVERACGTCGHSHRLALCLAIERHANVTPPPRALALRTAFSEIERALARLWLLTQVGRASEFGALFTFAVEARETLFEACVEATDARLFWGVPVPGGATNVADPGALTEPVAAVAARLPVIERLVRENGMLSSRGKGIGRVAADVAEDLRLTGLLARAAGVDDPDLRRTAPYDAYDQVVDLFDDDTQSALGAAVAGDVASRSRLAVADLRRSLGLIAALLDDLPDGQERATFPAQLLAGETTASIEGPHGRESIVLRVGDPSANRPVDAQSAGWLGKLTLNPPSRVNCGALPIALVHEHLSDVPLVLASLDLCVACIDL